MLDKRLVVVVFTIASYLLLYAINSTHLAKHHAGLNSVYND